MAAAMTFRSTPAMSGGHLQKSEISRVGFAIISPLPGARNFVGSSLGGARNVVARPAPFSGLAATAGPGVVPQNSEP